MKSYDLLRYRQNMPLDMKIILSESKIFQFHNHYRGNVCISFSGGKDSLVLLHLVRKQFPDTKAAFVDTGLEFPEIRNFVKTISDVLIVKPKIKFKEVIEKYGYPVVSKEISQKIYEIRNSNSEKLINKRLYGDENGNGKISEKWKFLINAPFKISNKCCDVMKKAPFKKVMKDFDGVFVGTMAEESRLRTTSYLKSGCINYNGGHCMPLAFWTEKDIWEYIEKYNLKYSEIYDKGYTRTGCMFCMFGLNLENSPNRFEKMKKTHPKIYDYCMENLGLREVIAFICKNNKEENERSYPISM